MKYIKYFFKGLYYSCLKYDGKRIGLSSGFGVAKIIYLGIAEEI